MSELIDVAMNIIKLFNLFSAEIYLLFRFQ